MNFFQHPDYKNHEQVVFASDPASGLRAIIAIHNTALGSAVGGCRMYPYANEALALTDALRLSSGMTYKAALANLPFGGGKSVIMGDPRHDKSPALMRAMGRAVNRLGGRYILAEDSGTGPEDMRHAAEETSFVAGVEDNQHGGDPSPMTALGVFLSIKQAVDFVYHTEDLRGLRVAVQGLGHVGYHLAMLLHEAGATLYGADLHQPNLDRAVANFGLVPVSGETILKTECDVLAPCALGGILNARSIPEIRTQIIAGAANNQLGTTEDDLRLMEAGIVYCPDFAINAGGIIEVYHQGLDSSPTTRQQAIEVIPRTLLAILQAGEAKGSGTDAVAIQLAEAQIADHCAVIKPMAMSA